MTPVPQAIPYKLLYTIHHFHMNRFAILLVLCDHQAKLGQNVNMVVVAKKVEAVDRKRATATAHQAEPNLVKCPHAL